MQRSYLGYVSLFVVIIIVIAYVIFFSFDAFSNAKSTIENSVTTSISQTVDKTFQNLNIRMDQYGGLMNRMMTDVEFIDAIKNFSDEPDADFTVKKKSVDVIFSRLNSYANSVNYISSVRVFSKNQAKLFENQSLEYTQFYNWGTYQNPVVTEEVNQKLKLIDQNNSKVFWFPTQKYQFFRKNEPLNDLSSSGYKGPVFILARDFTNVKRPYIEGLSEKRFEEYYLVTEIKAQAFHEILGDLSFGDDSHVYIVDENNQLVYDQNPKNLATKIGIDTNGLVPNTRNEVEWNDIDYMVYVKDMPTQKWRMIVQIPTAQFTEQIRESQSSMLIILALLAFSVLALFAVLGRFIRNFNENIRYSRKLEANAVELKEQHQQLEEANSQLVEQQTQLEKQNEQLIELNQVKDQILANTSHELRTPINGIIGIAESLIDGIGGTVTEISAKNLRMIIASGRRLSNLVNDILDFSKMKNNKLELLIRPTDITGALDLSISLLKPLIGKKPVKIISQFDEVDQDQLPKVMADENRLQQIFHNLISNAIKFTDEGQINISYRTTKDSMEISIQDSGIGIPTDKIDNVFASFQQLDGSISRKYGGTGLGLAVTKQLVEMQGGSIHVESEYGSWTKFTFTVRLASEEDIAQNADTKIQSQIAMRAEDPQMVDAYAAPTMIQSSGNGEHILIVDDEPVNLHVIVNHLSRYDYTISTAESGIEALAMMKNGLEPDLILLDVMMPKMSGYEVLRLIRKETPIEQLPILLLTAKNTPEDILTGFQSGANDYLVKPFNKTELLARIQTHLGLMKAHRRVSSMKVRMAQLLRERNVNIDDN